MSHVAVMGTGSWGTAFAMVLADAGNDVVCWGRNAEVVRDIADRHENSRFHPGVELSPRVGATTEPAAALDAAALVVLAVPSQVLRANLAAWGDDVPDDAVYLSLLKGIELGSLLRMSEVVAEAGGVPGERVAVLSGPNLAAEVAQRQPAAGVVASVSSEAAALVQAACMTPSFRIYTSSDVVGVELGGAVKNVMALAVGMAEGMGFGDNSKASLITRGLAETIRLGHALGARTETFAGLAGLGDLVATCSSSLSRNHTFGVNLGRGMSVAEVVAVTKQTAEGVTSAGPLLALGRAHGVDLPIIEQVVAVVEEGLPPQSLVARLMGRDAKPESAATAH